MSATKIIIIVLIIAAISSAGIVYFKPFPAQKKKVIEDIIDKDASTTSSDLSDMRKFFLQAKPKQLDTLYSIVKSKGTPMGETMAQHLLTTMNNMEQGA